MRHGQASRNYVKAFFAFVAVGMISACADSSVAPVSPSESLAFTAPANYNVQVGVKVFTINNGTGGIVRLGEDHVISFQAGAICSLLSSYGSTEWDKPCMPQWGSVVITATMMRDAEGHPYVDFQPAMRFAPTKQVMLFLRNGVSSEPTQLSVQYCSNLGRCVDESLNDSSLRPFRVGRTSIIGRRIKHFSGYSISAGDDCEGTLTDDGGWMCNNEGSGGGMERRSGYMVASGDSDSDDDRKKEEKKDHHQQ